MRLHQVQNISNSLLKDTLVFSCPHIYILLRSVFVSGQPYALRKQTILMHWMAYHITHAITLSCFQIIGLHIIYVNSIPLAKESIMNTHESILCINSCGYHNYYLSTSLDIFSHSHIYIAHISHRFQVLASYMGNMA